MTKIGYISKNIFTTEGDIELKKLTLRNYGCKKITIENQGKYNNIKLGEIVKKMKAGDVLVIDSLYDLSSSLVFIIRFIDELRDRKIGVSSISDNLHSDENKSMFDIVIQAFAKVHKLQVHHRNLRAKEMKIKNNKLGGRPPALDDKDLVEMIKEYNSGNRTVKSICNSKNISRTTFYKYLKIKDL